MYEFLKKYSITGKSPGYLYYCRKNCVLWEHFAFSKCTGKRLGRLHGLWRHLIDVVLGNVPPIILLCLVIFLRYISYMKVLGKLKKFPQV